VNSAYKKIQLLIHPDKNPNEAVASEEVSKFIINVKESLVEFIDTANKAN
jgi:DnaJ domain.